MVLSMTGYGKSENKNKDVMFSVEVKTLNNRFLEVNTRMHHSFNQYDREITRMFNKECLRGKILLNINVTSEKENCLKLNKNKLHAFLDLSRQIKKEVDINDNLLLSDILKVPEIYDDFKSSDNVKNKQLLFKTIKEALKDLNQFRKKEGQNISKDLFSKIKKINNNLVSIKKHSKNSLNKEYKILIKKIGNIGIKVNNLDKDRLYQEIALLIEKKDINEEIIRMKSHIDLFKGCMNTKSSSGKKMNFLLQEMLRETNTICSKGNNLNISHLAVNMKNNLEQLKEQVQNIL